VNQHFQYLKHIACVACSPVDYLKTHLNHVLATTSRLSDAIRGTLKSFPSYAQTPPPRSIPHQARKLPSPDAFHACARAPDQHLRVAPAHDFLRCGATADMRVR
jgi:hypothetical protein